MISEALKLFVARGIFTVGLADSITRRISNEVRVNYGNDRVGSQFRLDNLGGAVPDTAQGTGCCGKAARFASLGITEQFPLSHSRNKVSVTFQMGPQRKLRLHSEMA